MKVKVKGPNMCYIFERKCLLAPPGGVAIRTYWHPPPINFLDDAVLFHCSTAAGSCYPLQIQCMANRKAAYAYAYAGPPPPCPHSWQAHGQAW